jgi:hypothetical protein
VVCYQPRHINNFADALFHQWIHVDTERAKVESLSNNDSSWLLDFIPSSAFIDDIIDVKNLKQLVNYGIKI